MEPPLTHLQRNAPLEMLPPEIRRQLLSILALAELGALVHASPVFHQQYRLDRRHLLCSSLETTLRSTTIDACAVCRTGSVEFCKTRTRDTVNRSLRAYQDGRSAAQYSIFTEDLTEEEAVGIATFLSCIIKPLLRSYTTWALGNLADASKLSQDREPLSRTEERRLIRALYRFQLCCNLFGRGTHREEWASWQPRSGFKSLEILKIFICMFEPWEVEEIACVYTFAEEKYDQIFRDIRWDGTISRGLELLHYVHFKIRDHSHLVATTQEHISWPTVNFLGNEALGRVAQVRRRQERLSDRDRKQQRRDPLPFEGDSDEPGVNGRITSRPPQAWTWAWRETYSNLYGYYIPDDVRRWAYVMWDAARLERMGAKEILLRQWEAEWGNDDPRAGLGI
ncbi:hypothetical protein C7999DRAFT_18063 [Corynascus novoguineensis]|uniref:Uncharacterized protein n=1 Tax=Corynascus novoguineensis TaxID=1126955 RepID=A0AAN7HBE4_9PEZI|nr:hypothetical protein C7999DRAFT_18063 [Corynascus novoguineensis]